MNVVLVHGYLGHPKNAWFPWIIKELESRGFDVKSLKMPNPAAPERGAWVRAVQEAIPDSGKTILVGHSLGCAAILHAAADYPDGTFPGAVCVAGFGRPFSKILEPWFPAPLDFGKIRPKARAWTVIHSENDMLVPYAEGQWLARQLGAKLITKNGGHFRLRDGARELPEVLDAVMDTKP